MSIDMSEYRCALKVAENECRSPAIQWEVDDGCGVGHTAVLAICTGMSDDPINSSGDDP